MPSAWQIVDAEVQDWQGTEAIENLHLVHDIPKPTPGPGEVLLNIKAVSLNARDMMVVAHNPIYPAIAIPELVACADAAGVIEAVGPDSKWKVGDRVLFNPLKWVDGPVKTFEEAEGAGAGPHQGTLREYAVYVSLNVGVVVWGLCSDRTKSLIIVLLRPLPISHSPRSLV